MTNRAISDVITREPKTYGGTIFSAEREASFLTVTIIIYRRILPIEQNLVFTYHSDTWGKDATWYDSGKFLNIKHVIPNCVSVR